MMIKTFCLTTLVFLAGCAFYPSKFVYLSNTAEKPEGELAAVAWLWRPDNRHGAARIISLDGKNIPNLGHIKAIMVEPGKHTMAISYEAYAIAGNRTIIADKASSTIVHDLEPGRKYVIRSFIEGEKVYFAIQELPADFPIDCMDSLRFDGRRNTSAQFSHCAQ